MFFTRARNFIKTQIDILCMKVEFAAFARTVTVCPFCLQSAHFSLFVRVSVNEVSFE